MIWCVCWSLMIINRISFKCIFLRCWKSECAICNPPQNTAIETATVLFCAMRHEKKCPSFVFPMLACRLEKWLWSAKVTTKCVKTSKRPQKLLKPLASLNLYFQYVPIVALPDKIIKYTSSGRVCPQHREMHHFHTTLKVLKLHWK